MNHASEASKWMIFVLQLFVLGHIVDIHVYWHNMAEIFEAVCFKHTKIGLNTFSFFFFFF